MEGHLRDLHGLSEALVLRAQGQGPG